MRTTFGEMVLEVANDRRNVNDINTVVNTAPRKAGSHVSVTSPQAQPPPQALRFRMAEASAKRVTGDEPQGTMGRVLTAGEAFRAEKRNEHA